MRAISLWQPWASLVATGLKHFETRGWIPAPGPVMIHAASRWDRWQRELVQTEPFFSSLGPDPLPLGALVGVATIHSAWRLDVLHHRYQHRVYQDPLPEWMRGLSDVSVQGVRNYSGQTAPDVTLLRSWEEPRRRNAVAQALWQYKDAGAKAVQDALLAAGGGSELTNSRSATRIALERLLKPRLWEEIQAPTEHAFGDWSSAERFAWMMVNPVAFEQAIPYRGRQGFFDVSGEDVKRYLEQRAARKEGRNGEA